MRPLLQTLVYSALPHRKQHRDCVVVDKGVPVHHMIRLHDQTVRSERTLPRRDIVVCHFPVILNKLRESVRVMPHWQGH